MKDKKNYKRIRNSKSDIPLQKAKNIVENSGNNFHAKVIRYLRKKDWLVLVSPYYNDNITDKPREIDIIAEKAYAIKDPWGERLGQLHVRLFIECKYIGDEIVCWFDKKNQKDTLQRIADDTPLENNRTSRIREHHYMKDELAAKLFSPTNNINQQKEPFYRALNQILNAMLYFRHWEPIIQEEDHRGHNHTINYPIILCNNFHNVFGIDMNDEEKRIWHIINNFILEVNYAYLSMIDKRSASEYFLIDVVDFNQIDQFLKILEEFDINIISDRFLYKWERH